MDIVTFVLESDPHREPRVGARVPDEGVIVDLQAGHFSMYERPHPGLTGPDAFRAAGASARQLAARVAAWAVTERPPGVLAREDAVEIMEERTAR